ncbi:hypothetical protein [Halorarius halobius]|uniref:hypothetical protein n=1 Tax=Halorarius halobius TaxID=2962671 RepID=UPI0020CFB279|nr:hypothetical protein [Halorarius halobius]
MVVVAGVGAYVPLYRVDREDVAAQTDGAASGETAVPAPDENHVTMASEAADTALARAGIDGGDLSGVLTASVTDRFAEHGIAAHVAYRYGATGDVRTADCGGSTRAATDALVLGIDRVRAGEGPVLVVGVDAVPTDPDDDGVAYAGAGAGAVVLAESADDPAATVTGVGQSTTGFVERHRLHGEVPTRLDDRFEQSTGVPEAVGPAMEAALDGADPDAAVVGTPESWRARSVLGGSDAEHVSVFDSVGDAATASPFIDLAHALETGAGDSLAVVVYGSGGADAVALEAGAVPEDGDTVADQLDAKELVTYAQHLRYREPVDYQGVAQ